jgi:hypothetical protein
VNPPAAVELPLLLPNANGAAAGIAAAPKSEGVDVTPVPNRGGGADNADAPPPGPTSPTAAVV